MNYSKIKTQYKKNRLSSKSTKTVRHVQLWILRAFAVCMLIGVIIAGYRVVSFVMGAIAQTPDVHSLEIIPKGSPSKIVDYRGREISRLSSEDLNKKYVIIDQIPDALKNAVRLMQELESLSITEQLLKNQSGYTLEAKPNINSIRTYISEKYMALQLEDIYTEDEILEYFLNTAAFSQLTLGVQAASERYFNKDVSALTLSECALLAGIIKNPSAFDPIAHSSRCKNRQLQVLTSLQERGFISSEEYEEAIEDDVFSRVLKYNSVFLESQPRPSYFCDSLIASVIEDMKSELGYSETRAINELYTGGLTIYSTLDEDMQAICEEEINNPNNYPVQTMYQLNYQLVIRHPDTSTVSYGFSDMKKWYASPYGDGADETEPIENLPLYYSSTKRARQIISAFRRAVLSMDDTVIAESIELTPQPQISFVLMEHSTGAVKALVGGRDDETGQNRAREALRQPGTALSLLASYVPAIDTAGLTLGTIQNDEKYYYPGTEDEVHDRYEVYQGLCTLRKSISEVINVNAVKTLDAVTPKIGYDYLRNLGFSNLVDGYLAESGQSATDIALSLALGNLRRGVTNLEMSAAYAALANGGEYKKPFFYTEIIDDDGEEILTVNKAYDKRVMKDSTAWLITDSIKLTDASLGEPQMAIAGMSGTNENQNDAWFVGYTPYYTAGVWSGYDGGGALKKNDYTEKIWTNIMQRIHEGYEERPAFSAPKDILSATICTKCGKLAIENLCEDAVGGAAQSIEYYTPQTIPTETCDCHVRVRICKASGHLAGDACPEEDIYEVVYLQKKDETAGEGKTADSSLIMPDYLIDSVCEVHGG